MTRCDEFYEKWQKCGNFCEKHPVTAAQIEAYLDQLAEVEEVMSAELKILPQTQQLLQTFSQKVLAVH